MSWVTPTVPTSIMVTASRGALRGLFHAHMGWLFIHTQRGNKERFAPDLLDDPVISWVDRTFIYWAILGLLIPFALG